MRLNALSVKIGLVAVSVSILVSLVSSFLVLERGYGQQMRNLETHTQQLLSSLQPIAEQAVIDFNRSSALDVLNIIRQYDYLIQAELKDEFGSILGSFKAPTKVAVSRPLKLALSNIEVPLGADRIRSGTLTVTLDPEIGLQDFYHAASQTILIELLKFSFLGLVFYGLSIALLANPIQALAIYLDQADPGKYPLPMPQRRRRDELGRLAESTYKYLFENYHYSEQLKATQAELEGVLNTVVDGVVSTDDAGKIYFANSAAVAMFGYSNELLLGSSVFFLLGGESRAKQNVKKVFSRKNLPGKSPVSYLFTGRRQDGSEFPVEVTASAYLRMGTPCYIATIRDMEEKLLAEEAHRELENKLNQSQKLDALGQLAGGIAHDFNNILTIILGNAELAELRVAQYQDARLDKFISVIDASAERGVQLSKQLLVFSRGGVIHPKAVDVNASIGSLEDMLVRLAREDIRIEYALCDSGTILIDPGQFDQIMLNLVANASDAILGQGEISISTCLVKSSNVLGPVDVDPDQNMLCIEVADNGSGMSDDTKQRLFEPFFTTKSVGQGTGLGLATVFAIVKKFEGHINVESSEGEGAAFRIYFPIHETHWIDAELSFPADMSESLSGTILLCEDDVNIRELARCFLSDAGATVIAAESSTQALALAKEMEELHVLVTDVVMPEMNGKEVYNAISEFRDVGVVYVSGYTADIINQHGIREDGANFLAKPFSSAGLINAVRDTLAHTEHD